MSPTRILLLVLAALVAGYLLGMQDALHVGPRL